MHRKNLFKKSSHFISLLLMIFLLAGCEKKTTVVGQWREIGRTATLEFKKDGSFRVIDNQEMAVSGNYLLQENGKVRFEIFDQDSTPEILYGKIIVRGNEMSVMPEGGSEIERYERVK